MSEHNSKAAALNGSAKAPAVNGNKAPSEVEAELDREVIRCKTCGLVQYRTRTGNCRRCVRVLPPRVEFLIIGDGKP